MQSGSFHWFGHCDILRPTIACNKMFRRYTVFTIKSYRGLPRLASQNQEYPHTCFNNLWLKLWLTLIILIASLWLVNGICSQWFSLSLHVEVFGYVLKHLKLRTGDYSLGWEYTQRQGIFCHYGDGGIEVNLVERILSGEGCWVFKSIFNKKCKYWANTFLWFRTTAAFFYVFHEKYEFGSMERFWAVIYLCAMRNVLTFMENWWQSAWVVHRKFLTGKIERTWNKGIRNHTLS